MLWGKKAHPCAGVLLGRSCAPLAPPGECGKILGLGELDDCPGPAEKLISFQRYEIPSLGKWRRYLRDRQVLQTGKFFCFRAKGEMSTNSRSSGRSANKSTTSTHATRGWRDPGKVFFPLSEKSGDTATREGVESPLAGGTYADSHLVALSGGIRGIDLLPRLAGCGSHTWVLRVAGCQVGKLGSWWAAVQSQFRRLPTAT